MVKELTPSPGSKKALRQGCLCDPVLNNYGAGYLYEGEHSFCKHGDCPLHGVRIERAKRSPLKRSHYAKYKAIANR